MVEQSQLLDQAAIGNKIEEIKSTIAQINSKNHSIGVCSSQSDSIPSLYHEETIRKLKQHLADLQEKVRNDHDSWAMRGKQPNDSASYFRKAAKQGKRYCLSSERCLPFQTG